MEMFNMIKPTYHDVVFDVDKVTVDFMFINKHKHHLFFLFLTGWVGFMELGRPIGYAMNLVAFHWGGWWTSSLHITTTFLSHLPLFILCQWANSVHGVGHCWLASVTTWETCAQVFEIINSGKKYGVGSKSKGFGFWYVAPSLSEAERGGNLAWCSTEPRLCFYCRSLPPGLHPARLRILEWLQGCYGLRPTIVDTQEDNYPPM